MRMFLVDIWYQDADDGCNLTYVVIFEIVSVAAVSANYFSESLPPPPTAHWRRHVHSAGGGGGGSSSGGGVENGATSATLRTVEPLLHH